MWLIYRFAVVAAFGGVVLGLILRPVLKRRRLGLLSALSLLPVAAHALYLGIISWRGGLAPTSLVPFGLAVLAILGVGALLAYRWARTIPILAALTPVFGALVYLVVASIMWSVSLEATGVVPNAVAGAAAGLAALALMAMLMVFVPEPVNAGGKLRFPWRRP